jgi:uncharacterized membrane protein HdeD (DUF308 family)
MFVQNQMITAQLHKNWYWYLLLGIGLVVIGTLAMFFSYTATIFSIIYLAALLVGIGIFEVVQAAKSRFWDRFFLHLILAALYLLAGGFMLANPELNAITLTLLLAFFFAISGIFKIIFALAYRVPHRGWIIVSGILSLVLAFLIWQQWPVSGLWTIGLFVGIDAIFTGWSWIVLALMAKNLKQQA